MAKFLTLARRFAEHARMTRSTTTRTRAVSEIARVRAMLRSGRAREIREHAGLSVPEVADALNLNPSTVARWERGERVPRGSSAIAYAELLRELAGAVE